jgi:DNA polymerase-3 subunit beta
MQFLRSEFAKAFSTAAKASSGKVKAVLGNVRLKVEGSVATLVGTDTEIAIVCTIPAIDSSDMDILLPVDKMSSILALADGEQISIELTEAGLVVQSGFAEFDLPSMDPKEFPWPSAMDGITIEIPAKQLASAIRSTEFCVDSSSTRYQLGGVAFDLGGQTLNFVATDGRRLAAFETMVQSEEKTTCIVPQRACRLLAQSCDGNETAIITLSLNGVMVQCGNCTMTTRVIDGRFPNWRMVVPGVAEAVELALQPSQFSIALQQAAIVSDKESRSVQMLLSSGVIKLGANAEVGKSKVTVPVAYDGEPMDIRFDYKFAIEFCKAVDSGTAVKLFVNGSDKPMVWRSGENYQYVVMPMSKDN